MAEYLCNEYLHVPKAFVKSIMQTAWGAAPYTVLPSGRPVYESLDGFASLVSFIPAQGIHL